DQALFEAVFDPGHSVPLVKSVGDYCSNGAESQALTSAPPSANTRWRTVVVTRTAGFQSRIIRASASTCRGEHCGQSSKRQTAPSFKTSGREGSSLRPKIIECYDTWDEEAIRGAIREHRSRSALRW